MRKVAIGFVSAVILLLAGSFAWHAEAAPPSISVDHKTDYSLVMRVGCSDRDPICPDGKMLSCTDASSNQPNCSCSDCPEGGPFCPCRHPPTPNVCSYLGTIYKC